MRRVYRRVYAAKALDALVGRYARGSTGDGFHTIPGAASRRVRGLGRRPRVCGGGAGYFETGLAGFADFDALLVCGGGGGSGVRSDGPSMRMVMQRC